MPGLLQIFLNLFIVSTMKSTWRNLYSTTTFGHSSNRCCLLPSHGESVIQGVSRSTIVRCSRASSSSYRQACVGIYYLAR